MLGLDGTTGSVTRAEMAREHLGARIPFGDRLGPGETRLDSKVCELPCSVWLVPYGEGFKDGLRKFEEEDALASSMPLSTSTWIAGGVIGDFAAVLVADGLYPKPSPAIGLVEPPST